MEENKYTLRLLIDNLTDAQAIAIVRMFEMFRNFGQVGTSRNVTFFADGDGNFRLDFAYELYGGDNAVEIKELIDNPSSFNYDAELMDAYCDHKDIRIDFDKYAWELKD